jgi:hypothetical protein
MDVLLAAGGTGQEVAAGVLRLCYLTGRPLPNIVVFDSDIAQRQPGEEAQTRMQVLHGLDQQFQELGVINQSRLTILNPSSTRNVVGQIRKVEDLYANTGHVGRDDETLLSLLLDTEQRQTPVHNGFHGEPAVGSLLFAGAWERGTFDDLEATLNDAASTGEGLRVVLAGSVAGGVGTAVLPFISRMLTRLRKRGGRIQILAVLQLPWFQLKRSESDRLSLEPDVTQAQFDRNAACLVRGYLRDVQSSALDSLVLLGLPQPVERVSHGGDRQLETHHYICVCAATVAANLLDQQATKALLGENHKGVFGLSLKTSASPSAFDGPPAGPGMYLQERMVSVRQLMDLARSLNAYTSQLVLELRQDSPSSMHHGSVHSALKALESATRIHDFKQTVAGLDKLHEDLLRWLRTSLESLVGSTRADTLGVFQPEHGWDALASTNSASVLAAASVPVPFFAPPRRVLSLPRRLRPHREMEGRDAAWHYVSETRAQLLQRV